MIQKILIFNFTGINTAASILTEGLKLNKKIKVFSTTKSNYGADVAINSDRLYNVTQLPQPQRNITSKSDLVFVDNAGPHGAYVSSIVCDSDQYIVECQDLMEECDLVVIFDDKKTSTAHFDSNDGVKTDLLEFALQCHKDKVVMVDGSDFHAMEYGNFEGSHPAYYKILFKREKNLDDKYPDNVESLPFASEERYFASGKNFDEMWKGKNLNASSLFRCDIDNERMHTKKVLGNRYKEDDTFVLGNVFGRNKNDGIDEQLEGTDIGECVKHHHNYFNILSKVKINIEGRPGHDAFYTGRMMESLANGCCYFYPTPTYNVDFPNGLIDGEDFVIYKGENDLIKKVEYYLSHEDEMRTIAENGFNKLIKYHTSEVRAKEFIETCERYMCEN